MLFNSFQFLIFFPIVVIVYLFLPAKVKYLWLLAASYYFYMCWNPAYIVLILFSTVVTWLTGIFLDKASGEGAQKKRKLIVAVCFLSNLGLLVYFKYANFLLGNLSAAMKLFGRQPLQVTVDVLLPVGISFYTFQALGYTVDVYRGEVKAEKNLLKYALFVSFFPQLVAGPIERTKNLLSEIHTIPEKKLFDYDRITKGLMLMVFGMFQKLVIADRLAPFVDHVFDHADQMDSLQLLAASVGFNFQIYCDFAGYSTIAIGAAKVCGFTLMENFNTPYFAESIKEFWRRWHISLSTWFRDYLYIPLGGNRHGKIRKYCNILVTFLVSGLWHGAGWHFVAWGGLHGAYQVAGELILPLKKKIAGSLHYKSDSVLAKCLRKFVTFLLAAYAWIYFRANSLGDALFITKNLICFHVKGDTLKLFLDSSEQTGMDLTEWIVLGVAMLILLGAGLIRYHKQMTVDAFLSEQKLPIRWLIIYILLFATIIFGKYGPAYSQQAFIYFQF
ncbi:MAG: MBOAT family protein [Lachnospiraceae bacterium]|nr:MBOAT family protein [Lachnospiraceae bacterium]